MFRNTWDGGRNTLSTSGNGRGGGGGSMHDAARTSKPAISFIATIFGVLLSLGLMAGGWTYNGSRRLESTTMKCDMRGCKLVELTDGVTKVLTIPRMNIIRGELVRVENGAIVDPSKMGRSAQKKLGHTYAVVYNEQDSGDDDDESYDSFENDDDSAWGAWVPGQSANAPPAKKPTVTSAKNSKSEPNPLSEEEKKAAADRKEATRKAAFDKKAAQRARFAEERRSIGKEPVREPDEQKARPPVRREAAQRPMDDDDDDREYRFPGDAGTMQEKDRDEIARMEAAQGMAGRDHRERSQKAYEEASKKYLNKRKADKQMRQMGNNLHDRKKLSPDDPDSRQPPPKVEQKEDDRPKLERGEAQKDLSDGKDGAEEGAVDAAVDEAADTAADMDEEMKNLQDRLDQLKKEAEMKAGGRTISSVGGLESVGEDEARREGLPADGEAGALEGGRDYETLGEFVHAGAAGARRKLLTWKNRVKNVDTPAARRTREEIDRDAAESRDAHRRGHGHHQETAKKVAATVDDEVPEKGARHHHKAFHHKKEVPAEQRHDVHPSFHYAAGERKMDHGWKHQNRQWQSKGELKKLATSYNLGRSKSRKRKQAIDSYVRRRSHEVDFVDSNKWKAVGPYMMMIVGFISACFCLFFGTFRPKFSSRQTGGSSLEESLLTPEDRVEK